MAERTVEDRLREQYFTLLPDIRRVVWQLETEIRYITLPIRQGLKDHEQLVIKSRVKECESAIKSLLEHTEGRVFDPAYASTYSILDLPDLAGVRVLAFPGSRVEEVNLLLRDNFPAPKWTSKPKRNDADELLAYKYNGSFDPIPMIRAEYQVVPMLVGLFWDVEHAAIYKPPKSYRSAIEKSQSIGPLLADVEKALVRFGQKFEEFIQHSDQSAS